MVYPSPVIIQAAAEITPAVAAVRSLEQVVPFEDMVESGLLFWINKQAFHNWGYTLQFHFDDEGHAIGFQMLGDGGEPVQHDRHVVEKRLASFLSIIRPNPGKPKFEWFEKGHD